MIISQLGSNDSSEQVDDVDEAEGIDISTIKDFSSQLPPWRRECFSSQPYPDNYIDETFLQQLNDNEMSSIQQKMTVAEVFFNTSTVVQQISLVAIFLVVSKFAARENADVKYLVLFDAILIVVGIATQRFMKSDRIKLLESFFSFLLAGILLRIVAPVLQTLTASYSMDTVYALALFFSTIHLASFDYSYITTSSDFFLGTISLNAAMFTAVLLASRLKNVQMVVGFVFLGMLLFSQFPQVAKSIYLHSAKLYIFTSVLLLSVASFLFFKLDFTLLCIYLGVIFFTWVVSPIFFLYMQRFKSKKNGPWDIAKLNKQMNVFTS